MVTMSGIVQRRHPNTISGQTQLTNTLHIHGTVNTEHPPPFLVKVPHHHHHLHRRRQCPQDL